MAEAAGDEGVVAMKTSTHEILKSLPDLIFPLVLAAIGVYVFTASFGYQFETRAFASVAGFILICLSVSLFVREVVRNARKAPAATVGAPGEDHVKLPLLGIALAWSVGFFVSMLIIGYLPTVILWVFAFLLWSKASRISAVLMPAALWALMKFVLEYSLGPVFFRGILFGDKLPTFW